MTKQIDKESIIEFYKTKPMTLQEVSEKFKVCSPTVAKVLKEYNIPTYTKQQLYNPEFVHNYFSKIDTEEKAYFLGLILTDGNIFKTKDGRQTSISICFKSTDAYLLDKLKQAVQTNTMLVEDKRGCTTLAFRSNEMANDLKKYGIVPNKSLISILPIIDRVYMPHLIRGIFDGDGSVQSSLNKRTNKHYHRLHFTGSNFLIEQLKAYLIQEIHIGDRKIEYQPSYCTVAWNSINDVYTLGEYMYKDCTIYMKRKKELYDDFKLHYGLSS